MNVGRWGADGARARWFGRISGAHVVVVLAGLLGGVLTLAALRADAREVHVMVAAHDLRVGATLTGFDVRTVVVRGDAGALPSMLRAGNRARAIGDIVTAPVRRGDPLRQSDLAPPAAGSGARAVSFAVDTSDAVAGNLAAGSRIDVLGVARDGRNAGYVLVGAPVLDASTPHSSGPLHTNDGRVVVTVAVSGDDALRLVAAIADARVVVVDATGAAPLGAVPRYQVPGANSTTSATSATGTARSAEARGG